MKKFPLLFIEKFVSAFLLVVLVSSLMPPSAVRVLADEIIPEPTPVVSETPAQPEVSQPIAEPIGETIDASPNISVEPTQTEIAPAMAETGAEVTTDVTNTPTTETAQTNEVIDPTSTIDIEQPTNVPEQIEQIVESKDAPVPVGSLSEVIGSVVSTIDDALNSISYESISTESRYASNDGNFGVVFTTLPEGSHTVTIKKITLTPEEVEATGALSASAYDVTSDMADGSFVLDLSMSLPENPSSGDISIKYAETRDELVSAQDIAPKDVTVTDNTVTAVDVNHLTIFLVTSGNDTQGGVFNAGQLASLQVSDNSRLAKSGGWTTSIGTRNQEFVFGSAYPVNSSILSATVRIELQRGLLINDARLEYWNGASYDTVNFDPILPASSGVDQTFTFSVPTNYINTPAKINAFKVRVRAAGSALCPGLCTTDIDYLRLQVVTGDRPANIFPADQANISTASGGFTYAWSVAPYATTYEFERCSIDPSTNDCTVAGGIVLDSVIGLGTPDHTVAAGYTEALDSYWHTRVVFNDGQVSPWSGAFRLTIDNTTPVITYTPNPAVPDGANGWYITAVPIDFSCADTGSVQSGITTDVAGDTTFNEGAGQTATSGAGTCVDNAGNIATPVTTAVFDVDLTDPTISATRDVGPNGNGWNNIAVTVTFNCTDATSGIDTCTTPITFGEGAGQSAIGTAVDFSGRTATVTETPISIDMTAPTISATPDRAANVNNWYNADVIVTFTCADTLSGVDTCTGPTTLSAEAVNQSANGTVVDLAGNSANTTLSDINIDKTVPIITAGAPTGTGPNGAGWYRSNVTVSYSATDNLSGFMPITVAPVGTLSASMSFKTTTEEGTGLTVTSDTVSDLADNVATAVTSGPFKIDLTNPNLAITAPANDAYVSSTFTVSGTASDAISGIKQVRVQFRDEVTNTLVYSYFATYSAGAWTLDVSPSTNVVADGYYRVRVTTTDNADRTRTRTNRRVRVDSVTPVITITGGTPVTHEALTTYTDLGATAVDDFSPFGPVTVTVISNNVNENVIGTYAVIYSATDDAGNTSMATRTVNVIDTTIPVITRTGVVTVSTEALSPYTDLGATALDNYDGDITGSIVTTNLVNTNLLGTYTVTYNVSDSSGNVALPVMRTVNVVDTTKPVITMKDGAVTLFAGDSFTDLGATALDNYDGDITSRIVTSSTVNTGVAGNYSVTYNVTDLSLNAADAVTRSVTVLPVNNGPIDGTAPSTGVIIGAQSAPSLGGGSGGGGFVLGASIGPGFFSEQRLFRPLAGPLLAPTFGNGQIAEVAVPATGSGNVLGQGKFIFTKNLRQGMRTSDVGELQKRFVAEGLLTTDSMTGYFGRLTFSAAKAYQKKYDIFPIAGFVGPLTRAELNK